MAINRKISWQLSFSLLYFFSSSVKQLIQDFVDRKCKNVCWFRLPKCEGLLLFLSFMTANEESLFFKRSNFYDTILCI